LRPRLDTPVKSQVKRQNYRWDTDTMSGVLATEAEFEQRVEAATAHCDFTRSRVGTLVGNQARIDTTLKTMTSELGTLSFPESGGDGRVQQVDFKQGGGPGDAPPYPVNDIIAEATDLDGNRIILRRGYYDATTKRGWGWDKAYWKRGVVNPNVFKDLISHSRPVHQPDGTLRYDVPINRTHCTSGPLGIASCKDTGESLTMRIVVDPSTNRPDVPDGRQKWSDHDVPPSWRQRCDRTRTEVDMDSAVGE
jgi:hypothetical protein